MDLSFADGNDVYSHRGEEVCGRIRIAAPKHLRGIFVAGVKRNWPRIEPTGFAALLWKRWRWSEGAREAWCRGHGLLTVSNGGPKCFKLRGSGNNMSAMRDLQTSVQETDRSRLKE